MTLKAIAVVALGGAVGAALRYLVALWLAGAAARGEFPWATLLVNLGGTLLLAIMTALVLTGHRLSTETQLLVGTGFCGALTTFSTVALELVMLVRAGAISHALTYGFVSLAAALAIVLAVFTVVGVPKP